MSDDDLTPLSLPTTLPYPITITRLHASPNEPISRGSPILSYTFTSDTNLRELARLDRGQALTEGIRREDVRQGDLSATWESGIEGDFVRWQGDVEVGKVVERRHAS
jgi:RNA polymerase II subunit A-like phosphatase